MIHDALCTAHLLDLIARLISEAQIDGLLRFSTHIGLVSTFTACERWPRYLNIRSLDWFWEKP